jgi:acylphosphatase
MTEKTVIIKVCGRVQGVGFRYYTNKKAIELSIKGFVKNKPDGSVYIEAEGDENDILAFINWCQDGPPWARVSKVEHQFIPHIGFTGFEVR